MPVYHARSITVRLGSIPLAETTTSGIILKKGEVAKRQSEAAEKTLLRSSYLNEKRVLFPGDRDGFELNWLGNAPFMQAQVDPGSTQASRPDQESKASEFTHLQALTLHVKLSDKAFLSGFNGKTHLKIEVLFNGQLSTCSLIHTSDIRSGAKSLHQIFAGYRVDFLAERPWVLLPPFTTADGGARRFRKTITPTERWQEVSAALMKEAAERGTDKYGESPPSATFLCALASMDMPECVKTMQKPGGRKFGVVDVIITAGFGNKLTAGTNYLKRPQRLRDSDFIVRAEIKSDEEVAATAELDDVEDTTNKLPHKTDPNVTKARFDSRDNGAFDQRPRKRRLLSSVEQLPQYSPNTTNLGSSLNPFISSQIPVLPPSTRYTFQEGLSPIAGTVIPRCPSLEHRSDGHKAPLPAKDRDSTYSISHKSNNTQKWNDRASRIFQEYHSPPSEPDLRALQASSTNPVLSSMPLSENGAHRSIGGPTFTDSPPIPCLKAHAFGYQLLPLAQANSTTPMNTTISTTDAGPFTPYMATTALMLPTPTHYPAPPDVMTAPYYQSMHFQRPQVGSYTYSGCLPTSMSPNGLPGLLPQTPALYKHSSPAQFAASLRISPPNFQQCGPLPPKALFSVSSKPRRSSSPDKAAATNNMDKKQHVALVNRLVITGRNGKPIVDHLWSLPQRIVVNRDIGSISAFEARRQAYPCEYDKADFEHHARKQTSSHDKTLRATSGAASSPEQLQSVNFEQPMHDSRRDNIQDGQIKQAISIPLPYLKRHQGPTNEIIPINPKIDVPETIAPFVPAHLLPVTTSALGFPPVQKLTPASPVQPAMSQCLTFSRHTMPALQGPKATNFLFDDPEEVLCKAARMRRSRSPAKPTPMSSMPSPVHVQSTAHPETQGSSSPLSSVPSYSLSENSIDVADQADVPDRLPQLDGSPERTILAISPRGPQNASPTKPSIAMSKLQRSGLTNPRPPTSESSKKRKTSHQSPTRPPRSPDRLKTVGNPPLNDDCVITLAESADKREKRGVLRQVKGERQGFFREEYVALAVRFFIAGD